MRPHVRFTLCPGLLVAVLAAAGPAAGQDRAPAPGGDAAGPPAADAAPPAAQPAAPPAAQPKPPVGFVLGDFTFRLSGRIKLDGIRDFDQVGNVDAFDTRTIVLTDEEFGNSNLIAKETRLGLDIRGQVEGNELRMYVEGDFYGSNTVFRLRHAYGSYKWLLAGQTWTTFMDPDNLPRTIDFEAPTAFAQIRQAQIRVTQRFGRATWSGAVEDNKSEVEFPANIAGTPEFPTPDLVTKIRFDLHGGHIETSAFVGTARFRPLNEDAESVRLWGSMVSANFSTWGRDTIYGVVTYGPGIGRYRGGTAAVVDENGELHAVPVTAFMGGYEHFWAGRWSTNAVYSVATVDSEPFYPDDFNRRLTYGAINLLWWFLGDRAWTGVEYLYGTREVFGGDPDFAAAHRLHYAVRFNLP